MSDNDFFGALGLFLIAAHASDAARWYQARQYAICRDMDGMLPDNYARLLDGSAERLRSWNKQLERYAVRWCPTFVLRDGALEYA